MPSTGSRTKGQAWKFNFVFNNSFVRHGRDLAENLQNDTRDAFNEFMTEEKKKKEAAGDPNRASRSDPRTPTQSLQQTLPSSFLSDPQHGSLSCSNDWTAAPTVLDNAFQQKGTEYASNSRADMHMARCDRCTEMRSSLFQSCTLPPYRQSQITDSNKDFALPSIDTFAPSFTGVRSAPTEGPGPVLGLSQSTLLSIDARMTEKLNQAVSF